MRSDTRIYISDNISAIWKQIPLFLYPVAALLLSLYTVWTNDAVAYQYYSPVFDEFNARPINTIADLWYSQIDHYQTTNGRFVVHLFVQLFCGLLGKIPFAIADGIMWFVLLHASFSIVNIRKLTGNTAWFGASAVWLTFLMLPFDPPFQVNYVWVAGILCVWLRFFLHTACFRNTIQGILICIASLICGSLHEGFCIPIACALSLYLVLQYYKSRKISRAHLLMTIFFCIGTIITVMAPGNFVRLAQIAGAPGSPFLITVLLFIEEGAPVWCTLMALLAVILFCRKKHGNNANSIFSGSLFIILCIAAAISLGICLVMGHLSRVALPACYFMILAILYLLHERKISSVAGIVLTIIALTLTGYKVYRQHDLNEMTRHITTQYHLSSDGIIYDSKERILRNFQEVTNFKWVYTKRERLTDPTKPLLIVRPDIMRNPEFGRDTNMMVRIADQSWILVQSKKNPATFYIDKIFLPGIINKPMAPREVCFINNDDVVFDTIGSTRIGIYSNTRPYVRSSIRIE